MGPGAGRYGRHAMTATRTLELLDYETLRAHVNTHFVVVVGEDQVVLVMTDVSERVPLGPYENFSIEFRGPASMPLVQGTYEFEHQLLGSVSLFTVPTGRDSDSYSYEVVISRSIQPRCEDEL